MSVHPERREVFNWLDFGTIIGFMVAVMIVLTALLAITTWLSAWLAGHVQGDRTLNQRFTELGYQYAPVAMVSLVIGLGAALFQPLNGIDAAAPGLAKGALFMAGLIWSLWLGDRILKRQGVAANARWLPLLPGALGSLAVGAAWWPGIFGI
jgi:type IV secretory pathway VirB6-like protein